VRLLLAAVIIAVLVVPGFAGENPNTRLALDFDPPNEVRRLDPALNATFHVYIVLDCFGEESGTFGVAFLFERTFGGFTLTQTPMLGGMDMGDVEDPTIGWVIVSGGNCREPDEHGIVVAGAVTYLYASPPGHIRLLPGPIDGNGALDCNNLVDWWCVASHAGVHQDPPPPDPWCVCGYVPVEDESWGSIKGLYR